MELLIKKALDEHGEAGDVVEQIAEKIARGRRVTGRPSALKRHGTA
jgi:serine/threonine-protein phosphatase 2B catalytic subunit